LVSTRIRCDPRPPEGGTLRICSPPTLKTGHVVAILVLPEGGTLLEDGQADSIDERVEILVPPEGGTLQGGQGLRFLSCQVAILVPPEGGTLLIVGPALINRLGVAILAPPEGGTLLTYGWEISAPMTSLRSSSLPREGRCVAHHVHVLDHDGVAILGTLRG